MPPNVLVFSQGLDAIISSRPFFEFELVFLGNRGVINAICVVWGPQCCYHYVMRVLGLVFSVLDAIVALVYKSRVLRVVASTSEGWGYYYDFL